ncbi:MAG: hypothetical protein DRP82_03165 [Planctomycetota bacterium]|nr:MAG: hypothetical protein DRP82_03165 [Planctomycetota bacterium]
MRWAALLLLLAGCVVYEPYPYYCATSVYEGFSSNDTVRRKECACSSQQQSTTIIIKEEPRLMRVAETHIYWAPCSEYDIYFVDGVWYCYYRGCWFYAYSWRGPWCRIYYLPAVFWEIPVSHPRYEVVVRYLPPRRVERSCYLRCRTTRRYAPARIIRATPPPRIYRACGSRIVRSSPKPDAHTLRRLSPVRSTATAGRTARPGQIWRGHSRDTNPTRRSQSDRIER